MPRSFAPLLAAVLLALAAAAAASPAHNNAATDFIRKSCRATQYPSVCVKSLSSYGESSPPPRSPRELARAALAVSADRALAASAYVGRLCGGAPGAHGGAKRAAEPVRDCLEDLADGVGHLRDAAEEMGGGMGREGSPAFKWHLSNVQTWCSAALTDESTCLDGLSRGVDAATRAAIRGKVVEVAQVTSNALVLVNRVGPGY
ncbi:21 kDa protein-like [Phragmites australis]|uniref:21 kDa protein-like n=1 Tax=Phragmites australis TaxID=29695 RepID=UPI002D7758B1|nr:21 kDa protein-like [Phragmites australis]